MEQEQPRTKLTDLPQPEEDDVSGFGYGMGSPRSAGAKFGGRTSIPSRRIGARPSTLGAVGGRRGGLVAHGDNKYL